MSRPEAALMKSISATHNNKTHFTRNASSLYGAFFVFKEVINTMKTHFFKRGIAGLLSLVMCLSAFIGLGTTTAFAAGEQAEVYLISFPRSGDANLDYSGTRGHSNLHYMNGWYSGESKYTTFEQCTRMTEISATALSRVRRRTLATDTPARMKPFGITSPRISTALFLPTI